VTRALADQGRTIRLPVHVAEQVRRAQRSRRHLSQKLNREPTPEEIAKDSGFPVERVRELFDLVEDPVSLETPVGDGESMVADMIEDQKSESPDGASAALARTADLAEAIVVLCETRGRTDWREVELGGSVRRTLAEHLDAIRARPDDHPALRLPVPNFVALAAASLCDLLHVTPYGVPVLELLWRDNLPKANRLRALLGRTPTPVGVNSAVPAAAPIDALAR